MIKFYKVSSLTLVVLTMILGLSMAISVPSSFAAQDNQLEMKTLDLQVWPEYDDPRVLSIFNGTLTNTSGNDFNGRVYFNIPKGVEIKMACELINGSEHSCQPYDLEDKGDYQVLSWKATHSITPGQDYPIWLEYYYNPLKGSPDKTMDLNYTPYYKTQNLKLTIKEPLKSTNFKINPAPSSKGQDGEGFNNDFYTFQNIDSVKPVNFKISYTRSDNKPSVEPKKADANQQAGTPDPLGTSAWKKPEVLVPVSLFIVVLVAFIFYSLYYSKNRPPLDRIDNINMKYGKGSNSGNRKSAGASVKPSHEKKRIRQMLLDGEISEETYRELMEDLITEK